MRAVAGFVIAVAIVVMGLAGALAVSCLLLDTPCVGWPLVAVAAVAVQNVLGLK